MKNEYSQEYKERKQKVIQFLTDSAQQLKLEEQEQEAKNIERLCENIRKDLFSIVMVGEFSAGKSTFLNALMHKAVLPSFSTETTATVNFLRHKNQGKAGQAGVVYYRVPEGETKVLEKLSGETLAQVVSTRGNREGELKVAQAIDHVDLFLDSDFLKDGVMLVDSPGLNGIEEHHREITEAQIKQSHACIFLFGADRPGSKSDFEILRDLQSQVSNIFLVLNKIDMIRESEGETPETVAQKLKTDYKRLFPEETKIPPIWTVSARCALTARDADYREKNEETRDYTEAQCQALEKKSQMGEFEDRLWQYLTQGERTRDQLLNPIVTVGETLKREKARLEQVVQLLKQETGTGELIKQRQELENIIEENKRKRSENTAELRKGVKNALQELKDSADAQCVRMTQKLESQLENVESYEEMEAHRQGLDETLRRRFSEIARNLDGELQQKLLDLVEDKYDQYRNQLEEKLDAGENEATFQLKLEPLTLSDLKAGINLEQFEKEVESLRKKIEDLENQIDHNGADVLRAKKREKDLEDARQELKELKESRDEYQSNFVIPQHESRDVTVHDKVWRSGILGLVGNVLFGKKDVQRTETIDNQDVIDRSKKVLEEELNRRNQQIKVKNQEIEELRKVNGESSDELEYGVKIKERKLQQSREELSRRLKDGRIQMDKDAQTNLIKHKRELTSQIEDRCETFRQEVKNYLRQRNDIYRKMAIDLVDVSLNRELERLQKELDEVIRVLNAEGDQRDKKLQQAQDHIEQLRILIGRGIDLEEEIKYTMEDHLEQEELGK